MDASSPASVTPEGMIKTAAKNQRPLSFVEERRYGWVWEYCGPEEQAPLQRQMMEEPLGPYERQLPRLSGGEPNVYEYAEKMMEVSHEEPN